MNLNRKSVLYKKRFEEIWFCNTSLVQTFSIFHAVVILQERRAVDECGTNNVTRIVKLPTHTQQAPIQCSDSLAVSKTTRVQSHSKRYSQCTVVYRKPPCLFQGRKYPKLTKIMSLPRGRSVSGILRR